MQHKPKGAPPTTTTATATTAGGRRLAAEDSTHQLRPPPPKKPERKKAGRKAAAANSQGEVSGEQDSVQEQISESARSPQSNSMSMLASLVSTATSAGRGSAPSSSSVPEAISEAVTGSSQLHTTVATTVATTEPTSQQQLRGVSDNDEYAQDTFETLDSTLTPASSTSPGGGGRGHRPGGPAEMVTSTPTPSSAPPGQTLSIPSPGVGQVEGEYSLTESIKLTESISGGCGLERGSIYADCSDYHSLALLPSLSPSPSTPLQAP